MNRAHHLSWKLITWVSACAIALMGLSPAALAFAVSPDQASEGIPVQQADGTAEKGNGANTGNVSDNASGPENTQGTTGTNADNLSEPENGASADNAQDEGGLGGESDLNSEGSLVGEGLLDEGLLDEIAGTDISLDKAEAGMKATASDGIVIDHALDFTKEPAAGGWNANATVEEDGYSWDAENLTLALGNVEIGINNPANLVSKDQLPHPDGEVPSILCAIVLPDGSSIATPSSSVSNIWINVDNPSAAVAAVYCEGDLFFAGGTGVLWLQSFTDGTQSSTGVYASGKDITIGENTKTIIQAGIDGTAQCNGIYGIYAPDANLYVWPNSATLIYASSKDGTVKTGICGAYVNGFEIEGSKAENATGGTGYENIDARFTAGANGEAESGAIGLFLSGNDPDNTVFGVYGAARVQLAGNDVALDSGNWDEDLGSGTYMYALGYDETNPFVGFGTDDLSTEQDDVPVICLADVVADNEDGTFGYRYLSFEPVSLRKAYVSPAAATVAPGGSQAFGVYAEANYPESFPTDQDISYFAGAEWSVGDNLSSATVMDGATLKVAADETAASVIVIPSPSSQWNDWFPYTPWDPSSAVVTIDQSQAPLGPDAGGTPSDTTGGAGTGTLSQTGDQTPFVMGVALMLAVVSAGFVVLSFLRLRRIEN